jgi:hypothetical protein
MPWLRRAACMDKRRTGGHCLIAGMRYTTSGDARTKFMRMICVFCYGLNIAVLASKRRYSFQHNTPPSPKGLQASSARQYRKSRDLFLAFSCMHIQAGHGVQ